MKPFCFVLDDTSGGRTPKAMLRGAWQCRRTAPPRTFRRSYLDSLDWRLLRNGLYLVADEEEAGLRLRLISLRDDRTLGEAIANQLPVFVASSPLGELAAVLAPILLRRALVQQIRIAVTRHAMAIRNGQGDILAKLELELGEPPADGKGESGRLARRLWFIPVKGHERQNRVIIDTLSGYGVPVNGAVAPVTELIAASNIDTDRFDARTKLVFHEAERCDAAVKRLLAFFFAVMEANRPAVIEDIDTDCLHDFRVAVRRSRTLLGQMRQVVPLRHLERARVVLAEISQVTNGQRDLDVMLLNFDLYRSMLPARTRGHLDAVHACIMDQRRATHGLSAQLLRSAGYRRFAAKWRRYLESTPSLRGIPANAAKPVKVVADARIWKVYKRILAEGAAIDDASPADMLHALRKSCKTLRYLIEFFSSLYPADNIRQTLRVLKRLQDNLGEYQDLHVHGMLLGKTRTLLADHAPLAPESDAAIAQVSRALARRGDRCRKRFRQCFMVFGSEGHQRLFKRLFKA